MTPEERLHKERFKHEDELFETLLEAGFEPTSPLNRKFKDAYSRVAYVRIGSDGNFLVEMTPKKKKGPLVAIHPFTDSGEAQHYADTNRGAGYSARVFSRRLRADGEWIDVDVVVVRRKV